MRTWIAAALAPLALTMLGACAEAPETDPLAQATMIGLAKKDILVCMGEPERRRAPAQGTEIWTYAAGATTVDSPPWAAGLNFSALSPPAPCDVNLVLTNGRVSQVLYRLPDGRALPSGRQCSFAVWSCVRRRELL